LKTPGLINNQISFDEMQINVINMQIRFDWSNYYSE
jgi:hypothetical protein